MNGSFPGREFLQHDDPWVSGLFYGLCHQRLGLHPACRRGDEPFQHAGGECDRLFKAPVNIVIFLSGGIEHRNAPAQADALCHAFDMAAINRINRRDKARIDRTGDILVASTNLHAILLPDETK